MLKFRISSALSAILLGLAIQGCHSPAPDVTTYDPVTLGRSLATATRDFCLPYIVDGASTTSLTQRPDVTEVHYNIHGQDVTRYRFDDLPGAPEATLTTNDDCWIGVQEMPAGAIPALVAAFRRDLRLDGYTTSEVHLVPGPHTLVVGQPADPDAPPHSYSTCVHGQRHALIQMSGFTIDVTSNPRLLAIASCIPAE